MSIFSFPDRGPWGQSSWRGNCTGHVYVELFNRLKPAVFIDPMMGSGTSIEVAKEMNIEAYGLDLHRGFNILRDSIVGRVGKQADLVVSHPPYADMIQYSGKIYGEPHPDDLSRCKDDADFHEKLQIALINQREATKGGGVYGTIIGDYRRNGIYSSYQAEAITRMPSDELLAVLIKQQHNTTSGRQQYAKIQMPFILHEYILLWRKKASPIFHLLGVLANEQAARLRGTWRAVIRNVMIALGGAARLDAIYDQVASGCPEKVKENPNWKAKVRQILNSTGEYTSSERGVWALA